MRVNVRRVTALRLLAAALAVSLAVSCSGCASAIRATAAPLTRAAVPAPLLPAGLVRLREALATMAGTRPIELSGETRGELQLLRAVVPAIELFRADTAQLTESGAALLGDWGRELARHLRFAIEIEGHTDELGRAAYNFEFSRLRAEAVRDALLAAGVAPHRVVVVGLGEARPLASGRSIQARERNRRVEIRVRAR
jgi:outer membrane protein OmpA-like peptidoglycan-associated protein